MAILNVNPTRMNLLDLKKRVKTAARGHKLLKDKQDGLMQKFMEVIREAKAVREEVEKSIGGAFNDFLTASGSMSPEVLENALMFPKAKVSLEVKTKNVMSVHIPKFKLNKSGEVITYGFAQTTGELDSALVSFSNVFELLIKLAEIEKSAENLADELEKTRRRVNALEHVLIPNLGDTVKFISMKLGENERAAITNTMRVKSMLEEQEKAEKAKQLAAA